MNLKESMLYEIANEETRRELASLWNKTVCVRRTHNDSIAWGPCPAPDIDWDQLMDDNGWLRDSYFIETND